MRISDWSSDVCSSDLSGEKTGRWCGRDHLDEPRLRGGQRLVARWAGGNACLAVRRQQLRNCRQGQTRFRSAIPPGGFTGTAGQLLPVRAIRGDVGVTTIEFRSEEHKSELRSLLRISYHVFCLKKKK